jgi:5-deoxy-glucuronate isomerase
MSHLMKGPAGAGHQPVFKVGESTHWLGLDILRLGPGEHWAGKLADEEAVFVILGGRCSLSVTAGETSKWESLGGRADMFSGLATAVYAPRQSKVEVKAESRLEIAIAKAPSTVDLPAKLVTPAEVKVVSSGMANWRRDVRLVIAPGSAISQRLIVGETINPPGNWSGIPPHKHDVINERENILEEFYWFKAKPADGYGIQIMNDDGRDVAHVIGDNDVAVLDNGYHPTAAAPGVTIGYLWVLSGDDKAYDITIDPRFAWVPTAEAVMREMKS